MVRRWHRPFFIDGKLDRWGATHAEKHRGLQPLSARLWETIASGKPSNFRPLRALAQGSAPQGAQHPTVMGQTGTMYNGNNTNLQLPPEQNAYWSRLWAEPGAIGNSGPASAVAPGRPGVRSEE